MIRFMCYGGSCVYLTKSLRQPDAAHEVLEARV